jgi:acyl-coenzyme A synthetase/AMP-(fatty) acid ligase
LNATIQPNEYESEDSLAHLIFSSGTTGMPKGVCFTIRDLQERAEAAGNSWMPSKPFLCQLAQDTVSGAITYFHSIFNGETYFVPGSDKEDAELIAEMKVTAIQTSPAKLKDLLSNDPRQLDSLEVIQVAGGLLSSQLAEDSRKQLGVELVYIYGSTEVGLVAKGTINPDDTQTVGSVVSSCQVQILDELGHELPFDSDGTLRVKTNYQSRKYWKVADSGSSSYVDGWFYPGDMARLSKDGTLKVLGRVDEIVNLSGVKVDPGFIDTQISRYRGIKDFACFAIPDEIQLSEKLAIAIVFDEEINIDNFITHMRSHLGDSYPRAVVRVKEIPRNSMGKPNRLELRAKYLEGTGDRASN